MAWAEYYRQQVAFYGQTLQAGWRRPSQGPSVIAPHAWDRPGLPSPFLSLLVCMTRPKQYGATTLAHLLRPCWNKLEPLRDS